MSRSEAEVLASEALHGPTVELPPGACVLDVGANVGLFAMALGADRRDLRLFLFEPMPDAFEMLLRNVRERLPGVEARLFPFALGRESGTATFSVDPFASFATTMRLDDVHAAFRRDVTLAEWSTALLDDLSRTALASPTAIRALRSCLERPLVAPFVRAAVWLLARATQARTRVLSRRVERPVRTLSWVLAHEQIDRVHLLAIDVEGAELEVLAGLAESDWPKIEALVVEVHDVNGRFDALSEGLRRRGFDVREHVLPLRTPRLMGLRSLEAIRPGPRSA